MNKYKLIFVVCTYGASDDLIHFIKSVKELNILNKIIVANSFCDEESKAEIKHIAEREKCDFLDLENKGYGHSLNEGIEYATKNYDFEYLAITNADIIVKRMDLINVPEGEVVIAPKIVTLSGKKQNPFYIFPHFKLFKLSKLYRETFKKENSLIVVATAKIERIIFNILFGSRKRCYKKIYAGHGAFILFSKEAIDRLVRPFEDDIFLYCEENFLGYKLRKMSIPYYYSCDISVLHTEDGSQAFYKHKVNNETKKSIKKYHELIKNE